MKNFLTYTFSRLIRMTKEINDRWIVRVEKKIQLDTVKHVVMYATNLKINI